MSRVKPETIEANRKKLLEELAWEGEEWRDIPGYEGLYMASTEGRFFSAYIGKLYKLKLRGAYPVIALSKGGTAKTVNAHLIIAKMFVDNDDQNKTIVHHINECKTDCRASNLMWVTSSQNSLFNVISGKTLHRKYKHPHSVYHNVWYRKDRNTYGTRLERDGKVLFSKYFKDQNSAAQYYNKMVDELGVKAPKINIVDHPENIPTQSIDTKQSEEKWLPYPNEHFCKAYEVSDTGRIYSIKKNIILKLANHGSGYLRAHMVCNGKVLQEDIHIAVAKAFIKNTDTNKKYVNHIDHNKHNNCATNLEWCTASENICHELTKKLCRNRLGFFGIQEESSSKTKKYVARCVVNKQQIRIGTYNTAEEAAHAWDRYVVEHKLKRRLNFPKEYTDYKQP